MGGRSLGVTGVGWTVSVSQWGLRQGACSPALDRGPREGTVASASTSALTLTPFTQSLPVCLWRALPAAAPARAQRESLLRALTWSTWAPAPPSRPQSLLVLTDQGCGHSLPVTGSWPGGLVGGRFPSLLRGTSEAEVSLLIFQCCLSGPVCPCFLPCDQRCRGALPCCSSPGTHRVPASPHPHQRSLLLRVCSARSDGVEWGLFVMACTLP